MKNKNQFVVRGLIAGLAILGATGSYAAQDCQEMPGELHFISVEGRTRDEFGEYDLIKKNRIRLDAKAVDTCSEEFCIEDASIKTTFFFNEWTRVGHGTMKSIVNCLE